MIKRRDYQSASQIFTLFESKNKLSVDDGKFIKSILLYKQKNYVKSLSLLQNINTNIVNFKRDLLKENFFYFRK